MLTTELEKARRAHVEAVITDMLTKNWYRMRGGSGTGFNDPEDARPALENVAREIRQALDKPLVSAHG